MCRSTLAFVLVRASDPRRRDPLCPRAAAAVDGAGSRIVAAQDQTEQQFEPA